MTPPIGSARAGLVSQVDAIPDSGVTRLTLDDADTSNGEAVDIWGTNNATINGATTGDAGLATTYDSRESYDFDGSNDYLETDDGILDGATSFSVALWADYTGSSKGWPISQRDDFNNLSLFNNTNQSRIDVIFNGNTQIESSGQIGSAEHFVITYDGSTLSLYRDADTPETASISASLTNTNGFFIGVRSGLTEHHEGGIDDVRFYDKGLSSTEVSNLYNNGAI